MADKRKLCKHKVSTMGSGGWGVGGWGLKTPTPYVPRYAGEKKDTLPERATIL